LPVGSAAILKAKPRQCPSLTSDTLREVNGSHRTDTFNSVIRYSRLISNLSILRWFNFGEMLSVNPALEERCWSIMQKQSAMYLILLGGTCMSFIGLCMRLVEAADGFQILFYRSISLSLMVGLICCLRRRTGPVDFVKSLDRTDMVMGAALAIAFTTYVFAMLYTSVASTLFILTSSPFMAAILGWVWIGEKPHPMTWMVMVAASIGVAVMIREGVALDRNFGNIMALVSALSFSVMLVLARRSGKTDVLGGTFAGGVFAVMIGLVLSLIFGTGLSVGGFDMGISLFMGAFSIGIGIAFVTWGASYVPAAEVSILVLIESVLGPLWPWIVLGETLSKHEVIGGMIVLGSVVVFALVSRRDSRNAQAASVL
jgi:DME family drug/metabolite transporter